jgi:hypothetical protein
MNLSNNRLGDKATRRRLGDAGLSPAYSTISVKKKEQLKSALRKVDRQISFQFHPWKLEMMRKTPNLYYQELQRFTKLDEKRKNIRNKLKGYE